VLILRGGIPHRGTTHCPTPVYQHQLSTMLGAALTLELQKHYHRIIEWLGLEGTSRIMKIQHPCHRQGHQPPHLIPDQAAQGPIQPGLECLQGWGIHNLLGQPVSLLLLISLNCLTKIWSECFLQGRTCSFNRSQTAQV